MGRPATDRPGRTLLAWRRRRARRGRRRAFRRQHPEGRPACRPARPGSAEGPVRPQSEASRGAGDRSSGGRRHPGRPGLSIAEPEAEINGGNAGTAASAPRLEIRGGRRDAGRGGHHLGRDQRVLLLLRGQQAGRDRGRGGQGVVRRDLDRPVRPEARGRPRRRGPADLWRPRRNGAGAVVQEPVPATTGDQRADVPRCDRQGVRA